MGYSIGFGFGSQKEYHGKWFANIADSFFDELVRKCGFRTRNGRYEKILKDYLSLLTSGKKEKHYCEMLPLISIFETEAYLRVSPDKKIRTLYLECIHLCHNMYCDYMTEVR